MDNFLHKPFSDSTYVTYDLETYPNIFTAAFRNIASGEERMYEISTRRNDLSALLEYLYWSEENGSKQVGFNNFGFDYPILHLIMELGSLCTLDDIYGKVQEIINTDWNNRFRNVIWQPRIDQIDLFKIHHFDNVAKFTSLKTLEINMRMDSVQDLPFPPGTILTDSQMDTLCRYNWHDIDATQWFFHQTIPAIELRQELSKQYDIDMINFSDSKIGASIFTHELKIAGLPTDSKTPRDQIDLGECILDYTQFEQDGFKLIKEYVKNQIIEKTKGALYGYKLPLWLLNFAIGYRNESLKRLSKISYYKIGTSHIYYFIFAGRKKVYKLESTDEFLKYNFSTVEDFDFNIVKGWFNLNLKGDKIHTLVMVVGGIPYLFGTGGIHASNTSQTFISDEKFMIKDSDVKSYYPNLSIKNRFYPDHLGEEFCDIYEQMYIKRSSFKKGTPENAALKIALNASYGNSNNKYSNLYDPKFTMQITLNGQLLLCMLCEQLIKVPELTIIAVNTDGVCYHFPREHEGHVINICNWWEKMSKGLELEHAIYEKFFLLDVNSYIAVGI